MIDHRKNIISYRIFSEYKKYFLKIIIIIINSKSSSNQFGKYEMI